MRVFIAKTYNFNIITTTSSASVLS